MKTQKSPLSIRIIYWLSNIALGLFGIVFIATLVFNFMLYTEFFGNDIQLHAQLPTKVNFLEVGSLEMNDEVYQVEIVQATGKLHIFNTPDSITKKVGIIVFIIMGITFYLFWIFRTFIKNVNEGRTFTLENISILKKISYGILALWLITVVYMRLAYYYVAKNLEFSQIVITDETPNYPGILFIALFLWVLAHIFMTGLKLQKETDLTI